MGKLPINCTLQHLKKVFINCRCRWTPFIYVYAFVLHTCLLFALSFWQILYSPCSWPSKHMIVSLLTHSLTVLLHTKYGDLEIICIWSEVEEQHSLLQKTKLLALKLINERLPSWSIIWLISLRQVSLRLAQRLVVSH